MTIRPHGRMVKRIDFCQVSCRCKRPAAEWQGLTLPLDFDRTRPTRDCESGACLDSDTGCASLPRAIGHNIPVDGLPTQNPCWVDIGRCGCRIVAVLRIDVKRVHIVFLHISG